MSWQIVAIVLGIMLGVAGIVLVALAWWWGRGFQKVRRDGGWDWDF